MHARLCQACLLGHRLGGCCADEVNGKAGNVNNAMSVIYGDRAKGSLSQRDVLAIFDCDQVGRTHSGMQDIALLPCVHDVALCDPAVGIRCCSTDLPCCCLLAADMQQHGCTCRLQEMPTAFRGIMRLDLSAFLQVCAPEFFVESLPLLNGSPEVGMVSMQLKVTCTHLLSFRSVGPCADCSHDPAR